MNREVPFSSKRMLLTLTLCACAVILLQNHELSQRLSFPLTLGAMAAGLAVCFLFFIPSVLLKSRYNTDALCLLRDRSKPTPLFCISPSIFCCHIPRCSAKNTIPTQAPV